MSSILYKGTSFADNIDTYDLQSLYPFNVYGFEVEGLAGDDLITVSFVGRNGYDSVDAGEGDDNMYLFESYLSELPVRNTASFFGGFGSDVLTLSDGISLVKEFRINAYDFIEFTVQTNSTGELTDVSVSPTTEVISFGLEDNYLTEDIFNGRIRSVGFNERYARTSGDNADWSVKGLDTYSEYHDLNIPATTTTTTPTQTESNSTSSSATNPSVTDNITVGKRKIRRKIRNLADSITAEDNLYGFDFEDVVIGNRRTTAEGVMEDVGDAYLVVSYNKKVKVKSLSLRLDFLDSNDYLLQVMKYSNYKRYTKRISRPRYEVKYSEAMNLIAQGSESGFQNAVDLIEQIPGIRDMSLQTQVDNQMSFWT